MRVVNIHKRKFLQPCKKVKLIFNTLATDNDSIWPYENWPAIHFEEGLKIGSRGGHGIIRYTIIALKSGERVTFQFTKPDGFIGTDKLYIEAISENETEIVHEVNMHTNTLKTSALWFFVIRWLHDALIEEAFDKVENNFSELKKKTTYNLWVNFLRETYKKKSQQAKQV